MPDQTPFAAPHPARAARRALVAALIIALLLLGFYEPSILTFLTARWQAVLAAAGLRQQAEALQHGINGGIVKRFLPALVTYAGLYLGICLLLLRLLLPTPAHWHLALRLYAGTLAAYVALVVLGKLAGDATWVYQLSRPLLDFLVSPLPVAGLYILFRAGFGPTRPSA